MFVPFSLLPYRTAYLGFLLLNLLLLALAFLMLQPRLRGLSRVWPGLPPALFLGFYPVALALMQGQDSILLLALLAAALVSLERNRDLTAGALAGVGLFRFQIVVPIVLLFLLWRRWRFVKGFMFSAILVGLLSFITSGWAETVVFVHSLLSVGAGLPAVPGEINFPLRINIMANLRGLIYGLASLRVPQRWLQVTTLLLSSLVVISVRARGRQQPGGDALVLAITAGVVVSYYLFIHDLSILLIPIVLTLDRFISRNGTGEPFGRAAAAISALLFVAPMCILGIPAILIGIQLAGWVGFFRVIVDGHADFRQLYIAGYMVRTGHSHQLYDYNAQKRFQDALVSQEQIALPFNHLAYEALLFAAFSMLPFKTAYISFLFFNVALLWVSFRLLRPRLAALAGVWPWLPGAIFISFLPISAALMQGQDSIVLLTLLAGASVLLDQKRDLPAGVLVALGLAKFQICLPIALLFLAWRK